MRATFTVAKKKKRSERHIDWTVEPWAEFAFHHSKGREDFAILRRWLGFTQTRCAEFLGVARKTVGQWETLKRPMPRMAYIVLALLSESRHLTIRHSAWDGWHIARDGTLYGPGEKYGFTAETLRAFWIEIQRAKSAQRDAAALKCSLDDALRENTEIRTMFVNQGVVDELGEMQKRLGELLSRLNTAKVIPLRREAKQVRSA